MICGISYASCGFECNDVKAQATLLIACSRAEIVPVPLSSGSCMCHSLVQEYCGPEYSGKITAGPNLIMKVIS